MSSSVSARSILRRLKPEKRRGSLARRNASALPFVERASDLPRTVLYDTTVYVDILQGRFPKAGELAIRAADTWHSTVTEAELIAFCGRHLARYKVPRSIDFEEELPRLPTGKLYKRILRDRYWQGKAIRII